LNGNTVSSILKALQKLETDSNSFRSWKMNVRSAGKINRRPGGILFIGILLLLAILAFAGGAIYFRIPDGTMNNFVSSALHKYLSQPGQDTVQPMHRKRPEPQKKPVQRAAPSPGIRAVAQTGGLSDSPPLVGDIPDNRLADTVPEEPQQFSSMRVDKEKTMQKEPDLHTARLKTQQVQSPKPPATAVPETHVSKDASSPPIVHDPSISLQAIAWAEDPQDRIVVINGQILREGESLEGVIIEGIKEDRVIVRKGIESMTVLFRNK
jgi:hypothetical protein